MEDLNAQQLILLALFVSFVTSIATGIFTVSLLEQAPAMFTQTINRVVERTIETVVEGKTEVITTLTEVPTEDRITTAIKEASPALVRVVAHQSVSAFSTTTPRSPLALLVRAVSPGTLEGVGFVVDAKEGIIVTESMFAEEFPTQLSIVLKDGTERKVVKANAYNGIALLSVDDPTDLTAGLFAKAPLVLGQTVIVLGYDGNIKTTDIGFVSGYRPQTASSTEIIHTNIEAHADMIGGPLLTSGGEIVGLIAGEANIVPAQRIIEALQEYRTVSRQD